MILYQMQGRRNGRSRIVGVVLLAEGRVLKRSASEPRSGMTRTSTPCHSRTTPPLERPHTCYDIFTLDSSFASSTQSSLPDRKPWDWEEEKVVVSVTVEVSAGPVKAMVRLGSSIREAIAAVMERYDREGRSPWLDPDLQFECKDFEIQERTVDSCRAHAVHDRMEHSMTPTSRLTVLPNACLI